MCCGGRRCLRDVCCACFGAVLLCFSSLVAYACVLDYLAKRKLREALDAFEKTAPASSAGGLALARLHLGLRGG